jgi:hypothetical protein
MEDDMKTYLAAVALAAALAQPASAITFASLTTIYVGTGVHDDGDGGGATVFHCSNVSGVPTSVRFLVLEPTGAVAASSTQTLAHGATVTIATREEVSTYTTAIDIDTGAVQQGVVNIESLQSGVFCSAMSVDASANDPAGFTLPLVRVNPHPGTVE